MAETHGITHDWTPQGIVARCQCGWRSAIGALEDEVRDHIFASDPTAIPTSDEVDEADQDEPAVEEKPSKKTSRKKATDESVKEDPKAEVVKIDPSGDDQKVGDGDGNPETGTTVSGGSEGEETKD